MMEIFFRKLWQRYCQINPQAEIIHNQLRQIGEHPHNDHIALRTFNYPGIGLDTLGDFFVQNGYRESGHYSFKKKFLDARHYEHPDSDLPLVFISAINLDNLSNKNANFCRELVSSSKKEKLANIEKLLCSGRPWRLPNYKEYQELAQESEYAAWLSVFGFMANHFTISVNSLKKLPSLEALNKFVKDLSFPLNISGGEIKGSPEQFLEQSSTLAAPIEIHFPEGNRDIPGCYYEFARRYLMPNGRVFHGFISDSADKIFESTDRR